jgi:hypothetical protein
MTEKDSIIIPEEVIMSKILVIRKLKVMIDSDLAELYGVATKRLNEQVKRNIHRFPEDFMFQLTEQEKQEVVANCDHLKRLRFSPSLPYVFTEYGAVMLASVLNNDRAIQMNIIIVRVFIKLLRLMETPWLFVRVFGPHMRLYGSMVRELERNKKLGLNNVAGSGWKNFIDMVENIIFS